MGVKLTWSIHAITMPTLPLVSDKLKALATQAAYITTLLLDTEMIIDMFHWYVM